MVQLRRRTCLLALLVVLPSTIRAEVLDVLPGTQRLELDQPLDEVMVDGLDRFCLKELAASVERRQRHWKRDFSSREAYEKSVAPNRERLQKYLGVVDERVPGPPIPGLESVPGKVVVRAFRWPVLDGVTVDGVLLVPPGPIVAHVVRIPDSGWDPDASPSVSLQLARRGCLVLVPSLIGRDNQFSGHPDVAFTNQPHREWVYRPAFQMGRHIAGYEVQKVLAIVDLLERMAERDGDLPLLVSGAAEGGRIAFYAAALDTRIDGVHVGAYFGPREGVWREPIDHNVWRLLDEFGDAEIASLVAPRPLVLDACKAPTFDGPKPPSPGNRGGAAPGAVRSHPLKDVMREFERASVHYRKLEPGHLMVVQPPASDTESQYATRGPDRLLYTLAKVEGPPKPWPLETEGPLADPVAAEKRNVGELIAHTQRLLHESDRVRYSFWKNTTRGPATNMTPAEWEEFAEPYREHVWDELIGRLPEPSMPMNPRSRKVLDEPTHTGYEVVLDVYPDVIAGGILLLPKDLKEGERRPVVVCQHGLEGVPMDTITTDETTRAWRAYKGFATQLVKRGFVVYAPQNPYRGGDRFRTLQRKSNPLGRSLFSYIVRQHERTLEWLAAQPFVDADRIGFYGLSYGGKTAMRVPALLPPRMLKDGTTKPGYCLSICSADFNEWIRKNVTNLSPTSYVYTGEYEMFEWNMGHVANYAELAMLISPRPFMVERGHDDGVAPDEWVAWEYAKVRRHYVKLGIGDCTEIEWFDGPHTINGKGTFAFLHRHLKWPTDR